jgi:type VI protein secretion system component VasK
MIWMVGPALAFGTVRPLASVAVRLTLIVLVFLLAGGIAAWGYYKRRRAAAALGPSLPTIPRSFRRRCATPSRR